MTIREDPSKLLICGCGGGKREHPFMVWIDMEKCHGGDCGFCTKSFNCPGLDRDSETERAQINEAICSGCGACVEICPFGAIIGEEAVS